MQTSPLATLTDAQRRALAIAEAERWRVVAEAGDGTRATLARGGRRGRVLVLMLSGPEPDGVPSE